MNIRFFALFLFLTSCSFFDDGSEEAPSCATLSFLDPFAMEPNDCFVFEDNPDMTFTFLGFENYDKIQTSHTPVAVIKARLEEANFV